MKTYKLTRETYYNDVGINKAIQQSLKWKHHIQFEHDQMALGSTKGVNINHHRLFRVPMVNIETYYGKSI